MHRRRGSPAGRGFRHPRGANRSRGDHAQVVYCFGIQGAREAEDHTGAASDKQLRRGLAADRDALRFQSILGPKDLEGACARSRDVHGDVRPHVDGRRGSQTCPAKRAVLGRLRVRLEGRGRAPAGRGPRDFGLQRPRRGDARLFAREQDVEGNRLRRRVGPALCLRRRDGGGACELFDVVHIEIFARAGRPVHGVRDVHRHGFG
mmetsp:Transcript_22007/g.74605  ORF Transcript_22007/g.74605 Transcript_22007/m.74605 type:complete len:205 (-) Transcript_22007:1698-2312(-)